MNTKHYCMYFLSISLFWMGDLLSRVMYGPMGHLYPIYNWLMLRSCDISDKYNLDIWQQERYTVPSK